jgi:DNA polymerase III delta prime subunit
MTYDIDHKPLLSEVLRPQHLSDLNLPKSTLSDMQRWVDESSLPNLLFYGSPGIGKTSAAKILIKELSANAVECNGRDKTLARKIEGFCTTESMFPCPKICLIDEADLMSKDAQETIKEYLEKKTHVRFLLTTNHESKLDDALKSRFRKIDFNVSVLARDTIIEEIVSRFEKKLTSAGYKRDEASIRESVSEHYPDLRKVANDLH